jgi:hypothetical protein
MTEPLYDEPAPVPGDTSDEALRQLDWHARKVRHLADERHQLRTLFEAELARIEDRLQERLRILDRGIAWHRAPFESWHRAHPDQRTVHLPNATARLTVPVKPEVVIVDAEAVRVWACEHHPEIVRAPKITDVRACVAIVAGLTVADTVTGELVPGVAARVPPPTWTLTVDPGQPL